MKHESFKLFKVASNQINSPEVEAFLAGDVNPKSISIIFQENDHAILSIGYTREKLNHSFHLVSQTLNHTTHSDLTVLEKEIAAASQHHGGVICQDINLLHGKIIITFLTTK